ncbi:MAG: hypothetical protein WCE69_03605, partial [Aestuariivirga sp.]
FNEINVLANCNFLKSGRFAANFDLNDVFTQPRPEPDFKELQIAIEKMAHPLQHQSPKLCARFPITSASHNRTKTNPIEEGSRAL